ncbi:hypothetical protein SAMN04515620_11715 [Collimonas sp. OK607]|nr:hypothetical protein SAMN04515620_11715 [Collimonas sp. OK607]
MHPNPQRATLGGNDLALITKRHLCLLSEVFSGISFMHPSNH